MFHQGRARYAQREVIPEGAFTGGIRLRGYARPNNNQIEKACVCHGQTKNKITDVNKQVASILESHGYTAYTIEVYFEHKPPMIFKSITGTSVDQYEIIYNDLLNELSEEHISMLEYIQIEHLNGEVYEFTEKEIEEIKIVFRELSKGGFSQKKNSYMLNPWN
jgi:hypothetical protein